MIKVNEQVKHALGKVRIGYLRFSADVRPSTNELWDEVDSLLSQIKANFEKEDISKIPNISETRKAYKKCGKDPNRYRPSADSLTRRIVKGNALYKVNNVVDSLNYISLKSGISIGGYDLLKIKGDIVLDKGEATDEYFGIGRGKLNIEGLPVLKDDVGAFGSPTSDSERTMISVETEEIGFFFFDFGFDQSLEQYIRETTNLIRKYANGNNFETLNVVL